MSQTATANIVSFISALFVLGGTTGVTTTDVSGFVNVLLGIITLVGIVWSHFAHKQAVTTAATTGVAA